MSFNGEQFENFEPKKTIKSRHRIENKIKEPQDPEGKTKPEPCSQEEIN